MRGVLRVVALYALFAALWIFGSDWILAQLAPDASTMAQFGLLKGWAFVTVSALLLYAALRRLAAQPEAPVSTGRDCLPDAGPAVGGGLPIAAASLRRFDYEPSLQVAREWRATLDEEAA